MTKKKKEISFSKAIGSSEVIPLTSGKSRGPLDWVALTKTIQDCLESSGGRPTNPNWEMRRQIPFTTATWAALARKAAFMSTAERKVGPAQLSAFIIEEALESFILEERESHPVGAPFGLYASGSFECERDSIRPEGEVYPYIMLSGENIDPDDTGLAFYPTPISTRSQKASI